MEHQIKRYQRKIELAEKSVKHIQARINEAELQKKQQHEQIKFYKSKIKELQKLNDS